jgi:hypothetical protein
LVINQEKCVFRVEEVEFLGHHVNSTGVAPIASRVCRHLGAPTAHNGEGAARVPWRNTFLPPFCAGRLPHPQASDGPAEGASQACCRQLLDRRDAGGLCGSGWKCAARPPYS